MQRMKIGHQGTQPVKENKRTEKKKKKKARQQMPPSEPSEAKNSADTGTLAPKTHTSRP